MLNSLTSLQSRRFYQHAMGEFIEWYCSGLLSPELVAGIRRVKGVPVGSKYPSAIGDPFIATI